MHKLSYYIVNAITVYRLLASIMLLYFIYTGKTDLFKWFLAVSFFTDLIDGFLARRYKVTSVWGARLDSIADDLTVLMAIIGVLILKPEFIIQQSVWIIILLTLYLLQIAVALLRYGKISSFHTYAAKCAALFQGVFLILLFFLSEPPLFLFYIAAILTIIDLIEEIALVLILPKWQADVKGLYWVLKKKQLHIF